MENNRKFLKKFYLGSSYRPTSVKKNKLARHTNTEHLLPAPLKNRYKPIDGEDSRLRCFSATSEFSKY